MLSVAASIYLLLRCHNAFSWSINPPLRLRRWAALFCASAAASLLWWLLIRYASNGGDLSDRILLCSTLDIITTLPAMLCTMLAMLQDRRRPMWPVAVVVALSLVIPLLTFIFGERATTIVVVLHILIILCVTISMLMALRQYHRWLLDNFADLEHKEMWQTFLVLLAFLLVGISYSLANDYFFFEVFILVADIFVIAFLLWRVETMPKLEASAAAAEPAATVFPHNEKFDILLKQRCVDGQFYLKHNTTLSDLAQLIGTNNSYLSQYFANRGLTYNNYINMLRIEHFIHLYEEAEERNQDISATTLADKCGFSSYSTFSRSFIKAKGKSFKLWVEHGHR